jgi:hypothetical protein
LKERGLLLWLGAVVDGMLCIPVLQGYNMDYNEQYRDLSHLCIISAKGVEMHRDKS